MSASEKAIEALRKPDRSLASCANTVRQSIADVIESQKMQIEKYGLALMMIREGVDDPAGFADDVLGADSSREDKS